MEPGKEKIKKIRQTRTKESKKGITVLRDRGTRRYGGQGDEDTWAVVNLLT